LIVSRWSRLMFWRLVAFVLQIRGMLPDAQAAVRSLGARSGSSQV
jgi:hypothetical protein